MYSGPDDFIGQFSTWYGKSLVEPSSEVTVAGQKAHKFAGQLQPNNSTAADGTYMDVGLSRRQMLGASIDDAVARKGGKQVWIVVPSPSGFYVLAYSAPEELFTRYESYFNQMVDAFTPLKDGPGGAPLPGVETKAETPAQELERNLTMIQSHRDLDLGDPVCKREDVYGNREIKCSGLFETTSDLRSSMIVSVLAMRPAPVIPDGAVRDFAQGNVLMKVAKSVSDYSSAIQKYKEALTEAPWWGDAYNNLAIALMRAERLDEAKQAFQFYLLTKPTESTQVQSKIYEIDAEKDLQKKQEAALREKYGNRPDHIGFGMDDLYRHGAIVQDLSFNAGSPRAISLKVATEKENGYLHTYLTIIDITNSNDVFSRDFAIDWRGTQTFWLDDRGPNQDLMTLTVNAYGEGDANIIITPANNSSSSIRARLTDLMRERARTAVVAGYEQTIGTKLFYVVGQGGHNGTLLYFAANTKDTVETGSARDLEPILVVNVNDRNGIYKNTDLGDVDGTHYHLEYIAGQWVPKVGRGVAH